MYYAWRNKVKSILNAQRNNTVNSTADCLIRLFSHYAIANLNKVLPLVLAKGRGLAAGFWQGKTVERLPPPYPLAWMLSYCHHFAT